MSEIDIQTAIEFLKGVQNRVKAEDVKIERLSKSIFDIAIQALQEKQEHEQGCEYCNKDVMDGNPIVTQHSDGYVGNGDFGGCVIAKFCPMCGRRLQNE